MENSSEDILVELLSLRKVVDQDGTTFYYNHKKEYHRVYGPAVITKAGTRFWHQNGQKHRLDGPAAEYYFGRKEWWEYGIHIRSEFS